eukprot:CAMPEP_0178932070 /NCGR_PEP_ID=MMETSP0786-20121207/22366_1 /TAXON_ID=186022 /ORGANISM="Thalassionema frauenfeldii, Strain CCMP 1798" /LENGTH=252 /DNA_ID=CAMNT_0020609227 /DNA_START=540 /DNA_END=1298 /DNA_ORIENTATION=+
MEDEDEFQDAGHEFHAVSNASSFDDEFDDHRSVSPLNAAESFFLSPQLRTNQISANALASELRQRTSSRYGRSSRSGVSTIATDDFHSAAGSEAGINERYNIITNRSADAFFGKDIIIEQDENMASSNDDIDVAQNVYGKAKDIWAWGKDLPVVGFFEGVTESVAGKVVEMAGTTLSDLDKDFIAPKLADFDTSFLNPIVEKIVEALMAGGARGHELMAYVGKPLGLIEAEEKPGKKVAPEVTSTKRNAGVF